MSYDVLGADLRASLPLVDDLGRPSEPAALFLAEDGRPLTADDVRVRSEWSGGKVLAF